MVAHMPACMRISRALACLALGLAACTDTAVEAPPGVLTVAQEQQASWVRSFNPFHPTGASRWPTRGGIYEPLLIYNTMTGAYVPWLATDHAFSKDGLTLSFTIREGVKWSDGSSLSADDVAFTFNLMHQHPALDIDGVWGYLAAVKSEAGKVSFTFSRPFVPGLFYIARQPIVPEHVWRDVADPVRFTNPDPVASGPFTEVVTFENQLFELGKNPYYWQPGKPKVERLRMPAFSTNDQANLALVFGEVDWSGKFVPAIDRTFVKKDPEHHHYWFPLVNGTVMLYLNTLRPPFHDVRVRKALSLAINRPELVDVGLYGYTRPADAIALSDAYRDWRSPEIAEAADWVQYDARRASELFDAAGYPLGHDGLRKNRDGEPLEFRLDVVAGWSDWVRSAQVLARQMRAIGVTISVTAYDFGAWFDRLNRGDFEMAIAWTIEGANPYDFYRALMATATKKPLGTTAASNWHRFGLPEVDEALARFERSLDKKEQHALAEGLERAFVEHAPSVPLFLNPSWGAFNDRRFTGFPDAKNPYAKLTPNDQPDALLVLTELAPR
jgi:peptide/nickel transport system substrate-binding protein